MLDTATERTTTQEERVDLERIAGCGEQGCTDQAVVAKAILDADRATLQLAGTDEVAQLRLAPSNSAGVELVRPQRQLSDSRVVCGRELIDHHAERQTGNERRQ